MADDFLSNRQRYNRLLLLPTHYQLVELRNTTGEDNLRDQDQGIALARHEPTGRVNDGRFWCF